MTLFVYGCETCGVNSIHIRNIKKYAQQNNIELEIKNSKYNEMDRIEHAANLGMAGFSADSYQPIVVEGDKVTRLREWTS